MKFIQFYCDVYCCNIAFVLDCSSKECQEKFQRVFGKTIDDNEMSGDGCATILYDKFNEPVFVIWVERTKQIGTLIHELIHLALQILNSRGVVLDESAEPLTYYVEFLYNKANKLLKSKRKKNG